ncbi:MAG: Multifunctional fusion protein [Chloroflexi bacterium]|nr:Multifunctional fusion protein [Chloroflexota bacterium]
MGDATAGGDDSKRAAVTGFADVIVVAAGESRRMGGTDKVHVPLAGRPLLWWTLRALALAPEVGRIVVVTASGRAADVDALLPGRISAVVTGGSHRGASVEAGFRALEEIWSGDGSAKSAVEGGDPIVLVHDGARPLVSPALVGSVARAAAVHGAAIPVVPVSDTLKRVTGGRVTESVDRTDLVAAQTPQGVRASLLRQALAAHPSDAGARFTDEAALLAACTIPVHSIPGDPVNLKVTVPTDLGRAGVLLAAILHRRVGAGTDIHAFGPGGPLRLGGLEIAGAPALHGHSDGDVALHAVGDALLGAAALGDLGRLFPADDRTPRGVASADLLRNVVERLATLGWRPVAVDLTITGARPRLAGHLEPMRFAIADLLGLPVAEVAVKAATGNLAGPEGAGRALSASALVTIERPEPGQG